MTNWDKMLISIAIDAAKNCIHVFEAEYPTEENRRSVEALELRVWTSRDWKHGRAKGAAEACGCAARAARHPMTSAMDAINCEAYANGLERQDYSRKWLWLTLRKLPLELH
jgi:hypothetical protein